MSNRKRNPRVVAVEKMREAKRWLATMQNVWTPGTKVFIPLAELEPGQSYLRPREAHEYPENSISDLRQLAQYMRAIRVRCAEVEEIALAQIEELGGSRDA